ncbi:MAG: LytTR family DNA-binding domain-containing protein [Spirosomataceae bacterium]|jgi:DNA-binding LytR/AlgR family response regulator
MPKESRKLSYILVDDDEMFRDYLLEQLNLYSDLECLGVCENAFSTLEKLQNQSPDFLILDVEMPNLTGIQLVKSLKQVPLVIFVTSHPHYAVDAFELDAVDYLVKPFSAERLLKAINKIQELVQWKTETTLHDSVVNVERDSFFIKDKNTYIKIAYDEVLYVQSLGDFSYIYLQNGEKKIVLSNLKSLEQQLPSKKFVRISRTHLANSKKITAIDTEMAQIGKIQLSIGKTYVETAMKTILGNQIIKRFV